MEDRIKKIVDAITLGIQSKKLKWEKTDRPNELRVRLQHGFITLDKWTGTDEDSGHEEEMVDISIHNAEGEVIDRTHYGRQTDGTDYIVLHGLYKKAKDAYLNIDEIFGGIIEEIETVVKSPAGADISGIFHVSFRTGSQQVSQGIAVFKGGKVNGGDVGYTYTGSYKMEGLKMTGSIIVARWNKTVASIFGNMESFTLELGGNVSQHLIDFQADGHISQSPNLKINIVGKKISIAS